MERLLNMILRRLVNKGINTGARAYSDRQRARAEENMTAEEIRASRQHHKRGQQQTRGLRQATRMLRRISKF